MQLGAIIFSRMLSTRLPSKSLKLINGKPLFERVLDRLYKLDRIDHICLATTINTEDDVLCDLAKNLKVDVFRGSENNLISRAIDASEFFGYKNFIRVCGDRPFFDLNIYEDLINQHFAELPDLTTNTNPRKVPPGFSGEIISVKSLKRIQKMDLDSADKEHLTRYFYKHQNKFDIVRVNHDNNYINDLDISLTVDNKDDLKKIRWIAKKTDNLMENIKTQKIIQLAKDWTFEKK
jgi:spore coat polysaccharide biosynthesis protein SpsF